MTHRKKMETNWKRIIFSILVYSTVITLIWVAFKWSDFTGSLRLNNIIFSNTNLDKEIYSGSLDGFLVEKLDQFRLRDISDLLEEHPYVKAARVSHRFPGTLMVEIVEREPIAILNIEPMVMLDEECVVLPDMNNLGYAGLPVLSNFNRDPELYPAGERALSVKVTESINWLSRLQIDYESLYNNLSEMKLTSADEMELTLTEEPTTIYLGEENIWSRIEILREFERKLGNNAKKISDFDYLDMRFDKQIIVRARHS